MYTCIYIYTYTHVYMCVYPADIYVYIIYQQEKIVSSSLYSISTTSSVLMFPSMFIKLSNIFQLYIWVIV
jgi:hypothetical protein